MKASWRQTVVLLAIMVGGALLISAEAGPVRAETSALPQVFYGGLFNLSQRDGPDCRFSNAPFTSGEVQSAVNWAAYTGETKMEGSGAGWRRGLRCGDSRGDLYWTADYTIEAQGSFNKFTGEFSWFGFLDGTGTTQWFNCEEDGEDVACAGFQSHTYRFDVVQVDGKISCAAGLSTGKIRVLDDIKLPTTGQWFADQIFAAPFGTPLYVSLQRGEVTLNDQPLPLNCNFAVTDGDKLETKTEATVRQICREEDSGAGLIIAGNLFAFGKYNGAMFFKDIAKHKSCERVPGPLAAGALPPLELRLESGSLAVNPEAGGFDVQIETETLTAEIGAGGAAIVRSDPATDWSQAANLDGRMHIIPANGALPPFFLERDEQVDVTDQVVSPILNRSRLNLPFVSGN